MKTFTSCLSAFRFWTLVATVFCLCLANAADKLQPNRPPKSSSAGIHPGHGVTTKALDLTRPPETDELMAAGQLGGALFPTHELGDKQRERAARHDFGKAIEEWNKHEYVKGVDMFRKHEKEFPDSPWAAEAILHVGCDATYNGRYTEAETIFSKLIAEHQGKNHEGARMILGKARQRLGLLKIQQNNLEEAGTLFTTLLRESPDWRHRTYASQWIQRISRMRAAKQTLLSCGNDALAYVLKKDGHEAAALQVRTNFPTTMRGHALADLVKLAKAHGYELTAIQAAAADLPRLPLPAILHIGSKNPGDHGHYWVLDKVQGERVELFDPQSKHRFQQSVDELAREWSGKAMVLSVDGSVPGRKLDLREMEANFGGCCGAPRPPGDLGDPCGKGVGDPCGDCSNGAPRWSANVLTMNLFVTDTPMWYSPPFGPSVNITLSYNSQSSISYNEPFGNKWSFNFSSYLVMDTSGTVLVFMPDGRCDVFPPQLVSAAPSEGTGIAYSHPYQVFNSLSRYSFNQTEWYELRFPDDTVYVYTTPPGSQQPFLTEIRDAHTNRLTISYDANVHPKTITAADGKTFTLSYNADGLCTAVADPFGRTASFEYDDDRNLTKITDMGGYWSSFTYDTNVYLTSLENASGKTTFWIEAADGIGTEVNFNNYSPPGTEMFENYRITVTDPLGQNQEYFYYGGVDQFGLPDTYSWHVAPRSYVPWGSMTVNNYVSAPPKTRYQSILADNGQHSEVSQIFFPEGDTMKYAYDADGNCSSVTDGHGDVWQYSYNSMGRVTSVTAPKGTKTAFNYAANGVDLEEILNGLGGITMSYNGTHEPVFVADRLRNISRLTYNGFGQLLSRVDALGITNEFVYGSDFRLAELRRAGQTLDRFTHDTLGRVRTRTDATGLTLTTDYSNLDQVTRVNYPDGRFESYAYSSCCPRLIDATTDRGGRTTYFQHDALKRLTGVVNPEGGTTGFGYDANGNQTSLSDPKGNVTTFAYDLDNRLIGKTYADGTSLSFRYDGGGLLTTRTNARGIGTSYTYDANHNLLTTAYSDDTPGVTNTYDSFNRLTNVIDGAGVSSYAYDANSRLTSFDGPWADDTITYVFDPLGRRTNLLAQGSEPTAYDYDALGRLTGVRVGSQTYAYTYAGASPLVQRLDRPNGSYTSYQYDSLDRLTTLSNRRSTGQVINEFSYTYNAQDLRDSETVSNGLAFTFTNQLLTYEYNVLNQLLTSTSPSQVFSYDEDGNMTRGFTPDGLPFAATYDAENRLKSLTITNSSGDIQTMDYRYRGYGFLSWLKTYYNGTLSNETRFVREGYTPVQERRADNSVGREYVWGQHIGGGIGGLLNLKQGGQEYSYLYDGGWNVVGLLDKTQTVAANYAYEPFGGLQSASGSLDQPFRFSTKPYEATTGFSDYGHRIYSPVLGRWINRDPIGEKGGLNLYEFVASNPINVLDKLGLWTFSIGGGASLGAGSGWANSATLTVSSSDAFGLQIGWTLTHSEGAIWGGIGGAGVVISCSGNGQISDLSGTSVTSGGSFGPFSFDVSQSTSSSADSAYTLGIGKSWGAATYYFNSDTATGILGQAGGYGTPTP